MYKAARFFSSFSIVAAVVSSGLAIAPEVVLGRLSLCSFVVVSDVVLAVVADAAVFVVVVVCESASLVDLEVVVVEADFVVVAAVSSSASSEQLTVKGASSVGAEYGEFTYPESLTETIVSTSVQKFISPLAPLFTVNAAMAREVAEVMFSLVRFAPTILTVPSE